MRVPDGVVHRELFYESLNDQICESRQYIDGSYHKVRWNVDMLIELRDFEELNLRFPRPKKPFDDAFDWSMIDREMSRPFVMDVQPERPKSENWGEW